MVGLVAGPLLDRLSRKRLIIASDLVRLAVFAALPFVGSAAAIIVLAAVAGVANSFFRPAVLAGVPNLVAEEELAHSTSLLQATDWAATTLGPVLGGLIVSVSGPDLVYWINAATFLFSALLLVRIPARLLQSEQAITRGHWRDLAEGMSSFRRSAALITVLVSFGFAMLAAGLINVTEIFLAERALHRGAFGYGLLLDGDRPRPGDRQPDQRRHARAARGDARLSARVSAVGGRHPRRRAWRRTSGSRRSRWCSPGSATGSTFPMTVLIIQRVHRRPAARPRVHRRDQRAQPPARDRDGLGRGADRDGRAALDVHDRVPAARLRRWRPRWRSRAGSARKASWRSSRLRSIRRRGRPP